MLRLAGLAAFAIILTMPVVTLATTAQGVQMMKNWAQSDRCIAAAQKAFPDYTADSLAKRDAALQQCLATGILPPRAPQAPQEAPKP
jgi:hypothetical protein